MSDHATPPTPPTGDGEIINQEVLRSLQTGDVLLFNRKCSVMGFPVGASVCLFAKWTSKYDHVGLVVRPAADGPDAEPKVLEAGFRGVTMRPLSQRLDREHHNAVAVRHLLLDDTVGGVKTAYARRKIEEYAANVANAPYKRRPLDFLTGAAQPPEKREAIDISSALNAALRQDAALRRLIRVAEADEKIKSTDPSLIALAKRRTDSLMHELELLQSAASQHHVRVEKDLPGFIAGREAETSDGYFCSELNAAALQHAGVLEPFPAPTNLGAHDWASLASRTTADEVRHRRPPSLAPEAALGPELLIKREPNEAVRARHHLDVPETTEVIAGLESLGWGFTAAASAAKVWRPVFLQRGDTVDLGPLSKPDVAVIGSQTRLFLSSKTGLSADDDGCREGRCELLLPVNTGIGVEDFTKAKDVADGGWAQDKANAGRRATAVAESNGYVWVADAQEVAKVAAEAAASGEGQDVDTDGRRVRLRRAGRAPWAAKNSGERGTYALYVVEGGAVHDKSVDRVYRQGEVVGLDAFLAHLPTSDLHGGWDGPILTRRDVAAPEPLALRNGTTVRLVTYAEVLATGLLPCDNLATADKRPLNSLQELRRRHRVFWAHTDGRLQTHQLHPDLVGHMDEVHRHLYFDLDHIPKSATALLDSVLFQGRPDNSLLFSDVLRVEQACRASVQVLREEEDTRASAIAAAFFLGTQASTDGVHVSVTGINDLVHRIYRGRSDAPFLSLATDSTVPTGDHSLDKYRSDANLMSRPMIFSELLQCIRDGVIVVPVAIASDTVALIDHVNVKCCGGKPVAGESEYSSSKSPNQDGPDDVSPERYVSEDLCKLIDGEAWDFSDPAAVKNFMRRLACIVGVSVFFSSLTFPFQMVVWQRQLFGRSSNWTLRYIASPSAYIDAILHNVHALVLHRVLLGMVFAWAIAYARRPPEPEYDATLDEFLPAHPTWERLKYAATVCAGATALTYPMEVFLMASMQRTAVMGKGSAVVNYYAAQTAPRSIIRQIWDQHGIRGFVRGFHWSLVSLTPFFGAHWLFYHELMMPTFMEKDFAPSALYDAKPHPDAWFASQSRTIWGWKAGVVGAAIVAHTAIAHPVDTIRFVAMARQVPFYKAFATLCGEAGGPVRLVRRLYSGCGLHLARQGPLMAATFAATGSLITDYNVGAPKVVKDTLAELNNRSLNPIHQHRRIT